jgi:hypothetical protein
MTTTFLIEFNMKTAAGFERFARFDLGCDREFALRLFSTLDGHIPMGDDGVLHIDLVEKRQGLPVNMHVLSCSIAELSNNVKIITRELFKRINLEDMPV